MGYRAENEVAADYSTRAAARDARLASEPASRSTAYSAWLREESERRRWEEEAHEYLEGYRLWAESLQPEPPELWAESLQPEPPEPPPCEGCGRTGWHKKDCN